MRCAAWEYLAYSAAGLHGLRRSQSGRFGLDEHLVYLVRSGKLRDCMRVSFGVTFTSSTRSRNPQADSGHKSAESCPSTPHPNNYFAWLQAFVLVHDAVILNSPTDSALEPSFRPENSISHPPHKPSLWSSLGWPRLTRHGTGSLPSGLLRLWTGFAYPIVEPDSFRLLSWAKPLWHGL